MDKKRRMNITVPNDIAVKLQKFFPERYLVPFLIRQFLRELAKDPLATSVTVDLTRGVDDVND